MSFTLGVTSKVVGIVMLLLSFLGFSPTSPVHNNPSIQMRSSSTTQTYAAAFQKQTPTNHPISIPPTVPVHATSTPGSPLPSISRQNAVASTTASAAEYTDIPTQLLPSWFPPSMQSNANTDNPFTLYLSGEGGGSGGGSNSNLVAPTITFNNITKNYGDATFTVAATSNSSGTLTYMSSDTSVATVFGDTMTIVGAGQTTLTADEAQGGNFSSGSQTATLTVNAIAPTITFNSIVKNYGDPSFSLTASSDSSGSFTYTSNSSLVATVSGSTVTIVGAGSTTLTTTEAANGNYTSGSATTTLTVNPIAPTITFNNISENYGASPFALSPTSNSSGTFTFTSGSSSVAIISGSMVTVVGAGTSTITAVQAASGNYTSATTTATLAVNSIAPTIGTFSGTTTRMGDTPFTLTAPSSNSAGTFTYSATTTSVVTISGSTVTPVGAGSVMLTATQAASGNYTAGTVTTVIKVLEGACEYEAPCDNGGSCTDEPNNTYSCSCLSGYSGPVCALYATNCDGIGSDSSCFNGGTCIADDTGGTCSCTSGYMGQYCQFINNPAALRNGPTWLDTLAALFIPSPNPPNMWNMCVARA